MTLWNVSHTTILSLMALLSLMISSMSPPVLSLETGYDYDTNENPTTADRYGDLKCTYLFAGLTHMRLIKLMLEDKYISTSYSVGTVNHCNIRGAICTLYDVTDVEIGSLWLLLLYASTVQIYYKQYIAGSANSLGWMAAVDRLVVNHDYVTGSVQRELSAAGCRPGNRFDSYDIRYARLAAAMPSGTPNSFHVQNEALHNCQELTRLLNANNAQSTYGTRYQGMKAKQLFIDNLGVNKSLKSDLMTAYDVQVSWDGTFELLKQDWEYAHKFYSPTVILLPLFSIKKYYRGVFSLFKVIMFRLTWKFLLHVNTFTGPRRENHLKEWHGLLVEFQKLLRLQDDPDVTGIVGTIDRLSRNDVDIGYAINKLVVKLHKINVCLQCEATNMITLEQYPSSAYQAEIESNSVKEAKTFIAHLKSAFRMVDFDIIRSIVLYIDDKW